jgi:hypothetical protein
MPDTSRPILYHDEETGETILGGEDSPRADALRAELKEKSIAMLAARYEQTETKAAPVIASEMANLDG